MINEEHLSNPDTPTPRLMHIQPGQFFTLRRGEASMLMLDRCEYYAYTETGKVALSSELCKKRMDLVFGDGKGWRSRNAE